MKSIFFWVALLGLMFSTSIARAQEIKESYIRFKLDTERSEDLSLSLMVAMTGEGGNRIVADFGDGSREEYQADISFGFVMHTYESVSPSGYYDVSIKLYKENGQMPEVGMLIMRDVPISDMEFENVSFESESGALSVINCGLTNSDFLQGAKGVKSLDLSGNDLESVDLSQYTELINFSCSDNPNLTHIELNKLTVFQTFEMENCNMSLDDIAYVLERIRGPEGGHLEVSIGEQIFEREVRVGEEALLDLMRHDGTHMSVTNEKGLAVDASKYNYSMENKTISFNEVGSYSVVQTWELLSQYSAGATIVYKFEVDRALSNKAELINLQIFASDGANEEYEATLDPVFSSQEEEYSLVLPYTDSNIRVLATAVENASFINGSSEERTATLKVGSNTITTWVQSEDGSNTKAYIVNITRKEAPFALIESLIASMPSVQEVVFDPVFEPNTLVYSAVVNGNDNSISFEVNVSDKCKINTEKLSDIALVDGDNSISIEVESSELAGVKNTYTFNIYKKSAIALIENLQVFDANDETQTALVLSPVFDAETNEYELVVEAEVEEISLTASLSSGASINGIENVFNTTKVIDFGSNLVELEVLPEDQSLEANVYTLNITRNKAKVAQLEDIVISTPSEENIALYFEKNRYHYYFYAENEDETVSIFATPAEGSVILTETLENIAIDFGENIVEVVVASSEDKNFTNTYSFYIYRLPKDMSKIVSLEIFDVTDEKNTALVLSPAFDKDTLEYQLEVAKNASVLRVVATASESSLVNGEQSIDFEFNLEENGNKIELTASLAKEIYGLLVDDQIYTINITRSDRALGTEATLESIKIKIEERDSSEVFDITDFDKYTYKYDAAIAGVEVFEVEVELTDPNSTYEILGVRPLLYEGDHTVVLINVTSEDKSLTNTYEVTVYKRVYNASLEELQGLNAFVYPNPTANMIYFGGEKVAKAILYSSSKKIGEYRNVNSISLGSLANGVYILNAFGENGQSAIFKIVKK